ncbi:bacterial surface protein 26-residue repeat [Oligella urethralis]|uniref:BspA family leucine-rich repeat surface protein n=1 Tax=Oligella urethralis TaxID=90245 RepID=UPI000E05E639|nr:BspA family leucine-rich repeat surface protein [Oligella urethralis]SUA63211.1 bacterial surface protein 26-residue repeat [Oligella urethralis]
MQVFENNLSGKLAGPFYASWGGFIEVLAPGEHSAFQGGSSYGKLYIDTSEDDKLYQYLRNFTDNYIDHPEEAIAKFTLIRKGSPTEFQIIEFSPADKWNRNTGLIMWRLSEESPDNFKYIDYDTNLMFEAGDLIEMRLTAGTLNDFSKSFYYGYQERKKIVRNQETLEKDINKLFHLLDPTTIPSTNKGDRNDLGVAIKVVLFAPFNYPTETQWEFSEDNKTWSSVGNLVANKPYYVRFRSLSPFFTDLNMRNHIKEVLDWGEDIETITGIFGNRLTRVPDYLPRKITSLRYMFRNATSFNQDISKWDTSGVTNFEGMFEGATSFNQDISNWDTSNVTDFSSMFEEATSFNQDISSWNTTSVLNMNRMFYGATSFNQDLSRWDGSNASNADFASGSGFEEDTSKHPMWAPPIIFKINGEGKPLTYVSTVSAEEDKFYQLEGKWYYIAADKINNNDNWVGKQPRYARKQIKFYELFGGETSKLSIIDNYLHITIQDKHGVTKTIPLSQVITSRLISTLPNGFELPNNHTTPIGTIADISTWDTSNLTSMRWFLSDEVFLQVTDISQWNTSKVTNMDYAFNENSTFNQDLSEWCVPLIKTKPSFFAERSPLENSPEKHPKWGTCPRGEDQ